MEKERYKYFKDYNPLEFLDSFDEERIYQESLIEEAKSMAREEGLEEGLEQGVKQGKLQEKIATSNLFIQKRYQINAIDWLKTLTLSQLNKIPTFIFICATFEELKLNIEN